MTPIYQTTQEPDENTTEYVPFPTRHRRPRPPHGFSTPGLFTTSTPRGKAHTSSSVRPRPPPFVPPFLPKNGSISPIQSNTSPKPYGEVTSAMDSTPPDNTHTDSTRTDTTLTGLSSTTLIPLDITVVSPVVTVSPGMLALYIISSMISFVALMAGVTSLILKIMDRVHAVTTCKQCCYFWCCCPPHVKTERDGSPTPPTPPQRSTSYGSARAKTTSQRRFGGLKRDPIPSPSVKRALLTRFDNPQFTPYDSVDSGTDEDIANLSETMHYIQLKEANRQLRKKVHFSAGTRNKVEIV